MRAVRSTNDSSLLSFAGSPRLLPLLLPSRTHGQRQPLKAVTGKRVTGDRRKLFLVTCRGSLSFEVIRYARHHHAFLKKQRAFEQQRALVVQELLAVTTQVNHIITRAQNPARVFRLSLFSRQREPSDVDLDSSRPGAKLRASRERCRPHRRL